MEYRWGLLLVMLSACEPEPQGPVQILEPEVKRFDTEQIRREIDRYKSNPSPIGKKRMENAFEAFDARIRELEETVQTVTGEAERSAILRRIANLKERRQLHWSRSQTIYVETQPVKRAERVAERVEPAKRPARNKISSSEQPVRVMRAVPVRPWER